MSVYLHHIFMSLRHIKVTFNPFTFMWVIQLRYIYSETGRCPSKTTLVYQKSNNSYVFRLVLSHFEVVKDCIVHTHV